MVALPAESPAIPLQTGLHTLLSADATLDALIGDALGPVVRGVLEDDALGLAHARRESGRRVSERLRHIGRDAVPHLDARDQFRREPEPERHDQDTEQEARH